ncbi:MAG: septal ring lytic transglycosylase RlpA family protein [bacterium]
MMKVKIFTTLAFILVFHLSFSQGAFLQYGKASFYADKFQGNTTANGEIYKHTLLTAAHLTLPFGTKVRVTNLENKKEVIVRINDRGPFVQGRVIDLSKAAALQLGILDKGVADVKIEVLDRESLGKEKNLPREPVKKKEKEINKQVEESGSESSIFYQMDVKQLYPKGHGVQVGSFVEKHNLIEILAQLKEKSDKDVILQVVNQSGIPLYRIILGPFNGRTSAEDVREQVKKEFPDAFIFKF